MYVFSMLIFLRSLYLPVGGFYSKIKKQSRYGYEFRGETVLYIR
jgi:hypothetical protein